LFSWAFLMAYFTTKLKSSDNKASSCFRPLWLRNVTANVYLYRLHCRFRFKTFQLTILISYTFHLQDFIIKHAMATCFEKQDVSEIHYYKSTTSWCGVYVGRLTLRLRTMLLLKTIPVSRIPDPLQVIHVLCVCACN
jgi:hypothetical protein